MPNTALILSPYALNLAYGEPILGRLQKVAKPKKIITPAESWHEHRDTLAATEVIFSGWGAPKMDAAFLDAVPKLRAVFYAAGSVRYFTSEAFWQRGIRLTSAQAMNAIPVSEYAASALLLGLKRFWHYARQVREQRRYPTDAKIPGAFGSTIGLISYGTIARQVRERLRSHDVEVIVYDPYLSDKEAQREQVLKVASLEELFASADAVSLHTPLLPQTVGMIQGRHFEAMREGSFFLNTSRGKIIDEPAMCHALAQRPDITAVLDVTYPEPPAADSPLFTLPNVIVTPHLAGSLGRECQRMGAAMIDEFERYLAGQPLRWEINAERAERIA